MKKGLLKYRIAVVVLAVLLLAVVAFASFNLYDYTENDPTFCVNCHIMQNAYVSWEKSIHKGVNCHDCHYATILERNQMLVKSLLESPKTVSERPHEKIIVPSAMCIKCHWEGKKEIAKISESTGHAMHWFKGGAECTACHAIKLHQFEPEQKLCFNCHKNGRVVLPGMKDMQCVECHSFRKGNLRPVKQDCLACHEYRGETGTPEGKALAHTQFGCTTCHNTHDPDRPKATPCKNCHYITMKRGKHPVHLEALGNDCLACHPPHGWHISKKESKKLCSQCHKPYPLNKFGI